MSANITVVNESLKWNPKSFPAGWDLIHKPQIIVDTNSNIETTPKTFKNKFIKISPYL
jgi:hypothetical protein